MQTLETPSSYLNIFMTPKDGLRRPYSIQLGLREGANVAALLARVAAKYADYDFAVFGPNPDPNVLNAEIDKLAHESMVEFTNRLRCGEVVLPDEKIGDPRSVYAMLSCSGTTHYVRCPLDVYLAINGAFNECYKGLNDIEFEVYDDTKRAQMSPSEITSLANEFTTKAFINRLHRLHVRLCTLEEMQVAATLEALPILSDTMQSIDATEVDFLRVLEKYFIKYSGKKVSIEYQDT